MRPTESDLRILRELLAAAGDQEELKRWVDLACVSPQVHGVIVAQEQPWHPRPFPDFEADSPRKSKKGRPPGDAFVVVDYQLVRTADERFRASAPPRSVKTILREVAEEAWKSASDPVRELGASVPTIVRRLLSRMEPQSPQIREGRVYLSTWYIWRVHELALARGIKRRVRKIPAERPANPR